MNIEDIIRDKSQTISNVFHNISQNGILKQVHFKIDETKLDLKYLNQINITTHGDFVELFKAMKEFENLPALYFFEINPSIPKEEVISLIKNVNIEYSLNIPAQNNSQLNSGVLYVGKAKSCAWGRLIQHLGYHKNRKSHGLQLHYWKKENTEIKIDLSFTVMFFEENAKDYIGLLEQELAKSLNPIIGKHN